MSKNIFWNALFFSSLFSFCFSEQDFWDESEPAISDQEFTNDLYIAYPGYEEQPTPLLTETERGFDSRLQVGVNYTYANFMPRTQSSFKGSLGGMQALYEYMPMCHFYGGVKFAWRQGDGDGSNGRRSLLYIDIQERFGYTFVPAEKDYSVTLFTGLGYRHLGHKLNPEVGSTLRFKYNEFYFPVGILTNYVITSWFSINLDFTWMPQVYSTVAIVPLAGVRWDISNRLANFILEVPLTFALTENRQFFLIFKPFYEHWTDGQSTARLSNGTSLGLPGNIYNFYGADLNFAYYF